MCVLIYEYIYIIYIIYIYIYIIYICIRINKHTWVNTYGTMFGDLLSPSFLYKTKKYEVGGKCECPVGGLV